MTTIEIEREISDAFQGGEIRTRELRLTAEEADYVQTHFAAVLTPIEAGQDKTWYQITFRGVEN